jgi:hypothetical protein
MCHKDKVGEIGHGNHRGASVREDDGKTACGFSRNISPCVVKIGRMG